MYRHDFSDFHAHLADMDASKASQEAAAEAACQKRIEAKEEGIIPNFSLVRLQNRSWLAIATESNWDERIKGLTEYKEIAKMQRVYKNIIHLNTCAQATEATIREALEFTHLTF